MVEINRWREPIVQPVSVSPLDEQPPADVPVKSWREHVVQLDDIGVNHPGGFFEYQYTELRLEIDGDVAERQRFNSRKEAEDFINRQRAQKEPTST